MDHFPSGEWITFRAARPGPEDSASSRRVSVINETMARRYFRDQDAIGKRLSWGSSNFDADGFEIVGVVEDARYNDVRDESLNMAYVLATQTERYVENVQVRVEGDPTALTNAVRKALGETESRLAVGTIETLNSRIARSIGVERLLAWLTMAFGGAALGLACLGLYGTISYAVRRRTAELGMRIALGADRAAVQWLIVREALWLVLVGGAIGLPFSFSCGARCRGVAVRHRSVRSRGIRDRDRLARCCMCVRRVYPRVASVTP